MESISDVLKQLPAESMWRRMEEKTQQVIGHPLIVKWRAKYPDLDDHTLKIHVNRLYQYINEYTNCTSCPGLERCPNDFEGHYTQLSVEAAGGAVYIHDRKVSCKKWIAHQTQEAVRRRIRSFYVDEHSLTGGYSLDDILDKDPERATAVGRLLEYMVETKEGGLQRKGFYLVGQFGTGKTFLMCYMLHELAKSGRTGAIVYMPDFVEDLKNMFGDQQRLKETIDALKETDLLVFDDIGAENLNPWVRDHVMGAILNYRMNRKPTFFTSNYELDELEKHFSFTNKDGEEETKGRRIMERIRPFVEVIEVRGHNKRG
ncbi:primosomal protein DnaI [Paenibacillus sp. y28]|uniref:primosomal protein DnaI n=1 Tax=Paenibacillus sp. y28 TaxID=3129110 RepID=UPI00301ADD21